MDNLYNILNQTSSHNVTSSIQFKTYMSKHDQLLTLVANIPEMLDLMNVDIAEKGDSWVIVKGKLPNYFGKNKFILGAVPGDDIDVDTNELREYWNSSSDDMKNVLVELIMK